jgi:hypothetical protein
MHGMFVINAKKNGKMGHIRRERINAVKPAHDKLAFIPFDKDKCACGWLLFAVIFVSPRFPCE